MRTALAGGLLAVCLVACGGKNNNNNPKDGPKPPEDGPPDAPDLLKCANPVNGTTVSFRNVLQVPADGTFAVQTLVASPPNDLRLFLVDRDGDIRIIENEQITGTFIDLKADSGGPVIRPNATNDERGLLGLAFHPKYEQNGTFFVFYTRAQGGDGTNPLRDVLARCQVSPTDPNHADASSCVEVLAIPDFAANHNGGMIEFGKDGFLYISTGDGGLRDDPNNNGQALVDDPATNTVALLGKILRIDVDNKAAGKEYGIPTDNPFASGGGAPEIFALGLRNAWRWSFDRANGDVWIGDVGQNAIEELDYVPAGQLKGKNFGWSMFEASACFKSPCDSNGKTLPVDERTHNGDQWISITGGQVYRGTCYPDIVGTYFYTDFMHGGLTKATVGAAGNVTVEDLPGSFPGRITSIHEVATGEVYATDLSGNVWHLEAGP